MALNTLQNTHSPPARTMQTHLAAGATWRTHVEGMRRRYCECVCEHHMDVAINIWFKLQCYTLYARMQSYVVEYSVLDTYTVKWFPFSFLWFDGGGHIWGHKIKPYKTSLIPSSRGLSPNRTWLSTLLWLPMRKCTSCVLSLLLQEPNHPQVAHLCPLSASWQGLCLGRCFFHI